MKKIKRLLAKVIFTKEQRDVIYQSLVYSEYVYRKRGNVDGASRVQTVLNEVDGILGVIKMTYTKKEVDEIISRISFDNFEIAKQKVNEAFRAGAESVLKHAEAIGVVIPSKEFVDKENKTDITEEENGSDSKATEAAEDKESEDNSKE